MSKPAKKEAKKDDGDALVVDALKKLMQAYIKRTTLAPERAQPPHPALELAIKSAIKENAALERLLLEGQTFIGPFDSSSLEPIFETLRDTGYPLAEVVFSKSPLRNIDCMVMSQYLEQRSILTRLELLDCGLTAFACHRLGTAIGTNRFLTSIVFDYNRFGTAGVEGLCVGLSLNPKLVSVSLNACDIDHNAGEVLGNTLAHSMWQQLLLNNNRLKSVGAANLVKGLAFNMSLTQLSLQGNGIEASGPDSENCKHFFQSLGKAMETNRTLKECDVDDNLVGDLGGQEVLALYDSRDAKGLPALSIRVGPRMRAEHFEAICKRTKWPAVGDGAETKKKASKKKK